MNFNFTPNSDSKDPLKNYGKNITEIARVDEIDPIIGREDEINRIITILSRKTKNNPVLIGDPGVGKTAIVEGLAQRIVKGKVPNSLKNKQIIEISIGSIIAGASFQGEFEKRIKSLLEQVENSNGNIILFIDEIHTLIGAGKNNQGGLDAAQILKPLLSRGKIKMIGATTIDEYRKYIEDDGALERRMQKILVLEPSQEEAITIMRGLKERFETYHNVRITDKAIVSSVQLSLRYIPDRQLPDKAIDLVDEAAARIHTQIDSKPEELRNKEKKIAILQMEKHAISKDKDQKSINRINKINDLINNLSQDVENLEKKWNNEKKLLKSSNELKDKIENFKFQMEQLQNDGDYEKASIIMYQKLPEAKKKLLNIENKIQNNSENIVRDYVTENEIASVISNWTKIPIQRLLQTQKDKIISLPYILTDRIKGQNEALQKVSESIMRSKAKINNPNKPIGSFIFMGPTGVGKTEVAKALAEELFDSEKNIVRIDMSEYMEPHSISRLIGSSPGYVGFDNGGQLTEAIRKLPYSIVLFDEIEKAHPKVLDILLQILDDGHLTDGRGKTINFKNTIIIMTTNLGSENIFKSMNFQPIDILKKSLKIEFLNRVDNIIPFKYLSKKTMKLIANNELNKLSKRLKLEGYYISFSDKIIEQIVDKSYNPQFGARHLNRFIKDNIEVKLSKDIIFNNLKKEKTYEVSIKKEELFYSIPQFN